MIAIPVPCRLLDLVLAAQADGSSPLDAQATDDLVHEVTMTAIIQDALALDYTDAELLTLLHEAEERHIMLTRCQGDARGTDTWMMTPTTDPSAMHDGWTLATWRDAADY